MNRTGAEEQYVRLTGKKRSWTGFSQAWLGNDHLLIVHSIRFVERYQRFALSDIQAIVVTEGGRRAVWQALVVLVCISLGLSRTSAFAKGFWGTIGSVALALAIVDVARGPRCRCFLQTAVSRERLLCVSRMRTARSFLAVLVPAIESVQGTVPAEEPTQAPWPAPSTAQAAVPISQSAVSISQPPAIERTLGYAPEVLFAVLMLDSVLVFVALRSTVGVAFSLLPVVYFAEFLMGIFALVQSRARNAALLAVLAATFLCVLIDPFVLSGTAVWPGFVASVREASSGTIFWNTRIGASVTTMLLAAGWRAAIAVLGLLVCYFERTAARN